MENKKAALLCGIQLLYSEGCEPSDTILGFYPRLPE